MVVWNILDDSSGASQPAFQFCPYRAAQPVEAYVAQCVGIKVVSFTVSRPLPILQSDRRWKGQVSYKVRDVLAKLGHDASDDLNLCDEMGDMRNGFRASILDFRHDVQEGLPDATFSTNGAYLNLWNVPIHTGEMVQSGTWTASTSHTRDMRWQAFEVTCEAPQLPSRDAPHLAAPTETREPFLCAWSRRLLLFDVGQTKHECAIFHG